MIVSRPTVFSLTRYGIVVSLNNTSIIIHELLKIVFFRSIEMITKTLAQNRKGGDFFLGIVSTLH